MIDSERGRRQLAERVKALCQSGEPVQIQLGCGRRPLEKFLNVERQPLSGLQRFEGAHPGSVFLLDFDGHFHGVPDESVDFIWHEDFFEHLNQKTQVLLLADARRVLKRECWHRINTPCLRWSMETFCDFSKGAAGVHTREWDGWRHECLHTEKSLCELALLVGYRIVRGMGRDWSNWPGCPKESRPGRDRDPVLGNLYLELQK